MRVLLTGATGYIGKRLLTELTNKGHHVTCCVRDLGRFHAADNNLVDAIEVDFLKSESVNLINQSYDVAYYMLHSMSSSHDYLELEKKCANNFRNIAEKAGVEQVIYLSGITNDHTLSKHLLSRRMVENELKSPKYALTVLRAGIIIGSGSASFEIIRDLVEKLPVMVTPKWLKTKCQPIGIKDALCFLTGVLKKKETYHQNYDIGGPDVLTYKEILMGYAKARGLRRWIFTLPVMTPRLSSYWLYFVTSTSYKLAAALVDSMKIEVIAKPNDLHRIIGIHPMSYQDALDRTLHKVDENKIPSSWKDSMISGEMTRRLSSFRQVPEFGCFKDVRSRRVTSREQSLNKIWNIGGNNGWYAGNWLWEIRGLIDQLFGGVGLRRGRSHPNELNGGDALDFWRVLDANKYQGRLLLFAEMKLPGEAWLEFKLEADTLYQTATFRPKGLWGRLYWYSVLPFHGAIFKGMIQRIAE